MPSILVTGASRGLGLEFVRQYRAEGWDVVALCRAPAQAAALAATGAETHPLDVTDFDGLAALAQGPLAGRAFDVLLNVAGLYGGEHQSFGALDAGEWQRVLLTNVVAPLKVAEAFLPHVLGGQGRMMAFLTSQMGSIAANESGGAYLYRSSKAALNAAVKSLAVDLKGRVTALLLHPGWVRTDMGGPGAPLTPADSIAGLRRVIAGAGPAQSGAFLDYRGRALPW